MTTRQDKARQDIAIPKAWLSLIIFKHSKKMTSGAIQAAHEPIKKNSFFQILDGN